MRKLLLSVFIAASASAQQTENVPDVVAPPPVVIQEPEFISPAPRYIQIEQTYLDYLWDTEVLAQDSVRSLVSCRRELKKVRAQVKKRR